MPLILKEPFSKKAKAGFVYFETQKRSLVLICVYTYVYDTYKHNFYVCILH